jgi:hypothetical protein
VVAQFSDDQTDPGWWFQHTPQVREFRAAIQITEPTSDQDVAVSAINIQGDLAVAKVVMYTKNRVPAYRQTRFYRRTDTRWLPTAPNAALWGPERSLETTFFIFHFRQNDAAAVITIAPQLDALYTILRHNVGLGLPPGTEKRVIDVRVTEPPGYASLWFGAPERITVASPAVYWAPVKLTDAELLAQSIALPLLDGVIAQGGKHYAIKSAWQPMLRGLRLWQLWDLDLPLSIWHEEVVQWLYLDLPAGDPRETVLPPDGYWQLCAAHTLWMSSPLQLDIPLLCAEREQQYEYFPLRGPRNPPIRLNDLVLPVPPDEGLDYSNMTNRANLHGRAVVLATLIEYAVAAYGRERLPALLAGLGQYSTWDTLLPAVFGVSAVEFETGWQVYLTEQYAVSLP